MWLLSKATRHLRSCSVLGLLACACGGDVADARSQGGAEAVSTAGAAGAHAGGQFTGDTHSHTESGGAKAVSSTDTGGAQTSGGQSTALGTIGGATFLAAGAAGSSGTIQGSAGAGALGPRIELLDASIVADCMLNDAQDRIGASWLTTISRAEGSNQAVVGSAVLTIESAASNGGKRVVQRIGVEPPSCPLVGGTGSCAQKKTSADVFPSELEVCAILCRGSVSWTIDVTFDIGAARASGTRLECSGLVGQ